MPRGLAGIAQILASTEYNEPIQITPSQISRDDRVHHAGSFGSVGSCSICFTSSDTGGGSEKIFSPFSVKMVTFTTVFCRVVGGIMSTPSNLGDYYGATNLLDALYD